MFDKSSTTTTTPPRIGIMYWVRFAQDCLVGHLPLPPPHLVLELCIGFGLSVVVRPVKHHYHHQYLASQAPLPLPHIPIYMTILPSPYLHPTSWVLMYYVLQSNIIPIPYMTNDHWPWGNFMTEACTILTSNVFFRLLYRKILSVRPGGGVPPQRTLSVTGGFEAFPNLFP